MEEATLVTGNSHLNRGLSAGLSRAKEKSASKALMGLRHLKADDIGVLRYTRSSELGTQVKCSNHAYDVSSRKQVNMWHRDQRIAVAKLARGQQKMFRNLIRVQNDKRRVQRQARIRKQQEVQIELRERAVREREEAQATLRDMVMRETQQVDEVPGRDGLTVPPRPLPEINEETDIDIDHNDVGKGDTSSPALSKGSSKSNRSSDSGDYSPVKRGNSSKVPSQPSPARLPSQISPTSKPTTPSREMSQVLETVTKANFPLVQSVQERSLIQDEGHRLVSRPHFSREATQPRDYSILSATATDAYDLPESEKNEESLNLVLNPNKVLPGIVRKNSKDPPSHKYEDGASYEGKDSVFDDDVTGTTTSKAKDRAPKEKKRRKQSERTGPRSKYHIGIANRSFRLPDYQAPAVTSVVRYQRNSEGSLVPSEVAVKPASEEYKLPSRRAEYMVEKALEWEKKREDVREKKLQGFLERMKELERKEKLESRLATSLEYVRQEPFHGLAHPKDRVNNPDASSHQPAPHRTAHQSMGESLEAFHLKGDVQDLKNCRYLRLNDKETTGEAGHERGKAAAGRGRRGRRVSSWEVLGIPHGHGLTMGRLPVAGNGAAQHHSVRF